MILACKNIECPTTAAMVGAATAGAAKVGAATVDGDECQYKKTTTVFQITAMTKQTIPSQ
jgi:hypothetical protein